MSKEKFTLLANQVRKNENLFDALPEELMSQIFSQLDFKTLCTVSELNRQFYQNLESWPVTPEYTFNTLRKLTRNVVQSEYNYKSFIDSKIKKRLANIQDCLSEHGKELFVLGTCLAIIGTVGLVFLGIMLDLNPILLLGMTFAIPVVWSLVYAITTFASLPPSNYNDHRRSLKSNVTKAITQLDLFFNRVPHRPVRTEEDEELISLLLRS
ncbi:MAG: F-box protein [Legionella sp.]|nr:F-box protein [Legionella sp.]